MTSSSGIYLDWNADAPIHASAWSAYVRASEHFGNPSSLHHFGRQANDTLQAARQIIAESFQVLPEGVVLTSGGTEANHLALSGYLAGFSKGSVLVSAIEHPAVLKNLRAICDSGGLNLVEFEVKPSGLVDLADFESKLAADTVIVSTMLANNETGVIQPVQQMASLCRKLGVVMHCDAVQAVGRMPISVPELGVHLLTISSHKFGGVGGTGALLVTPGLKLTPQLSGGGQEGGLRGGTENVAGAAAMAAALQVLPSAGDLEEWAKLRDIFEKQLLQHCSHIQVLGKNETRLVNTSCVRFEGCPGDAMLMALDLEGIYVSTGSACSSGSVQPSPALMALGLPEEHARECVRFSFGQELTQETLCNVVTQVAAIAGRMRAAERV